MKKIVSMLLCILVIFSMCINVFAIEFTDLSDDHWAYQNVMELVNEGTINGYEDGSFKPSKTVTRAEFVKMIGMWDQKITTYITDLSSEHWGYDYLVWSGLELDGSRIYPDMSMLRADVINLIWKRNGSPKSTDAPSAISNQGTNKYATSWAYTIGLVQGDDGLNLRLDSFVTRAEAATLIIRSRVLAAENKKLNFNEIVSEKIKEQVYNSTNLFGGAQYDKDKTVTYGEFAQAVMQLGAGGKQITYDSNIIDTEEFIDHKYAMPLYVLANNVWGEEFYSLEYADKPIKLQDAVSGLIYGMVRRGGRTVQLGAKDAFYSDCVGANSTVIENLCLSYASSNGIKLNAGEKLGAQKDATLDDISSILIQIDEICGLELGYVENRKYNVKTNKDFTDYPENYKDYKLLIDGVPSMVYNIKESGTKPISYYKTASECSFIYATYLMEARNSLKSAHNLDATFMFYPSLTYSENGKITFIVKCNISGDGNIDVDTVFSHLLKENTELTAKAGADFYLAFQTYAPLMDIYLPLSDAYIKKVIIPN